MVKKIIIISFFLTFSSHAFGNRNEPVSEAEILFNTGKYGTGLTLLKKALRNQNLDINNRLSVMKALAEFYENTVGDTDRALGIYTNILAVDSESDHPAKASAMKEILRLKSLKKKYHRENTTLHKIRATLGMESPQHQIKNNVIELHAIVKNSPDYYRRCEAYYYLGLNYMALNKYYPANKYLKKSIELKPGINFYLPASKQQNKAYVTLKRKAVKNTVWGILGGLLFTTTLLFYLSRPWKWVKFKHLFVGIVMVLFWVAIFNLSFKWIGGKLEAEEDRRREGSSNQSVFIFSTPGSPGSPIAQALFMYGLVGIVGVFLYTVSTAGIKKRKAAVFLNFIFALLLFGSLSSNYYMRFCEGKRITNVRANNPLSYVNGTMMFYMPEPEPYVLTNPRLYSSMEISDTENPNLREWIEKYLDK